MKKALLVVALLAAVIYGCQQTGNKPPSFLKASRLPSTFFTVDITRDTLLRTPKGAVINIPQGALQTTGGTTVQLELKEAYSMADIIRAGLSTRSNGQPLQSGGMFYLGAVGENKVTFTQSLTVYTPTDYIQPGMQLYKGQVQPDSSINWVAPQPLPLSPFQERLLAGQKMFEDNCASCHRVDKDLTGPALAHIKKRRPYVAEENDLFYNAEGYYREHDTMLVHTRLSWYTKYSKNALTVGDCYFNALYEKWNKTAMPQFPALTEQEIEAIYDYTENESDRLNLPIPDNGIMKALDSCRLYTDLSANLALRKQELEAQRSAIKTDRKSPPRTNTTPDTNPPPPVVNPPSPEKRIVEKEESSSLYYEFKIQAEGWYNIDILCTTTGTEKSVFMVRVQGAYKYEFTVYAAIPSIKGLFDGGLLKGKDDVYGFYYEDGTIPLPQRAQVHVFAVGEHEGKIMFADTSFLTSLKQEVELKMRTITQEELNKAIQKMGIPDIKIQAEKTATGVELKDVIEKIQKAEELRPKGISCDCLMPVTMQGPGAAPTALNSPVE